MKKQKIKCPICNKEFKTKKWKARKGLLEGETIIGSVFCSRKCRKKFRLLVQLNDILEEIEKLNSQINHRRKKYENKK